MSQRLGRQVRVDLPDAAAVRALAGPDGRLAVRVTAGARDEAVEIGDARLLVKVRARPHDGAANAAVLALVARALGIAPSRVRLLRGATSREKLVQIS